MHRSVVVLVVGVILGSALSFGSARAERLGKGDWLLSVGVAGHTGQFIESIPGLGAAGFTGAVFRFEQGEVGGTIALSRFLTDHWALELSGGYSAGREKTDDFLGTRTKETRSFTVRAGGDRYAFIDDDVALFVGPGLFFTRGHVTSTVTGIPGPDATELGLDARVGMYARLAKSTGFFAHIGQVLSYTSGVASEGKISWWSSTTKGSIGLAFDF